MRAALDEAVERVRQLKSALEGCGGDLVLFKRVFKLRPQQAAVLAALLQREQVSHEALALCLPEGWADPEERNSDQIVKLHIHNLRRKLKPHGIKIETIWGFGYRVSATDKAKVMCAVEAAKGGDT